jgi:hypothetical protein
VVVDAASMTWIAMAEAAPWAPGRHILGDLRRRPPVSRPCRRHVNVYGVLQVKTSITVEVDLVDGNLFGGMDA